MSEQFVWRQLRQRDPRVHHQLVSVLVPGQHVRPQPPPPPHRRQPRQREAGARHVKRADSAVLAVLPIPPRRFYCDVTITALCLPTFIANLVLLNT